MKNKLGQFLLVAVVSLFGVLSASAQVDGEQLGNRFVFKGDTIQENGSLQRNQGIKSKNGQYIALMQEDGNFCQYKVGDDDVIEHQFCTETHGDEPEKTGNVAWMSNDGSFKIMAKRGGAVLFTTETGGSDNSSKGQRMVMQDDGRLIIYARDHRTPVFEFGVGKP